jgi:hypothetical protein
LHTASFHHNQITHSPMSRVHTLIKHANKILPITTNIYDRNKTTGWAISNICPVCCLELNIGISLSFFHSIQALRSVRFGEQLRKLSNVGQAWMGDQKFIISSSFVLLHYIHINLPLESLYILKKAAWKSVR